MFHPWLLIDALFRATKWGRLQRRAESVICDYARRVIALKRAQLREREALGDDQDDDDGGDDDGVRRKYTFLDMALGSKADYVLSDAEVLEEVGHSQHGTQC